MMGVMSLEKSPAATEPAVPKRRRWPRFGLRGLIALVTLAAIVFAPVGVIARRSQRQRMAIKDLTELGAVVNLRGTRGPIAFRTGPWRIQFGRRHVEDSLRYRLPPLQFDPVHVGELTDEQMPAVARALCRLDEIQRVDIESSLLTDDGLTAANGKCAAGPPPWNRTWPPVRWSDPHVPAGAVSGNS